MSRLSPPRLILVVVLLAIVGWLGWIGGPGNAFDVATVQQLSRLRLGSPSLASSAIAVTWLGSAYVTLGGAGLIAISRVRARPKETGWLVATIVSGRALVEVVKWFVARPRPHFNPWPVSVTSFSFPSGHATNSMLAFGAITLLLARSDRRWLAVGIATALAGTIGVTRPLLGVHWPSDVAAGWCLAVAVLLVADVFRPVSGERTAA